MPSWLEGRPFLITFAVLFGIVLLRAQATYWAGRGLVTGAMHTRFGRRLQGPRLVKAMAAINRWGLPVVTVSFLTVGFQTVVNGAAGLTRMRWGRYTLAMVPGCAAWAALYATVGLAAVTAWLHLGDGSRWIAIACAVAVVAAVVGVVVVRRRRSVPGVDGDPVDLHVPDPAGPGPGRFEL